MSGLYFQLEKADFAGEFFGTMCAVERDQDGEQIQWEGTKRAVSDWSSGMASVTGNKNFGNIRGQHDSGSAIGCLVEPPIIDEKRKRILVHGKVIDPVAKEKLLAGVYSGLSIGGNYQHRKQLPNGTVEYIPRLAECSLVDKPCSPSCVLSVTRADGSVLQNVSGAEDGSIMAGPEGARPPSLDGGEPGDHAGPLISEFSFEVK